MRLKDLTLDQALELIKKTPEFAKADRKGYWMEGLYEEISDWDFTGAAGIEVDFDDDAEIEKEMDLQCLIADALTGVDQLNKIKKMVLDIKDEVYFDGGMPIYDAGQLQALYFELADMFDIELPTEEE